ncbi:hypothetical protein [Micromonospora sp. NPDC048839]
MLTVRLGLGPWVLDIDAGRQANEPLELDDDEDQDDEPEAKQPFGFVAKH